MFLHENKNRKKGTDKNENKVKYKDIGKGKNNFIDYDVNKKIGTENHQNINLVENKDLNINRFILKQSPF